MAAVPYSALRRAQLSIEYLHTNSTTHEFLFGALAELVDNSRDAGASKIDIYTEDCELVRGEKILCFLDDGVGMSPEDSAKVIQFGYSGKRAKDSQSIGQYGNGLKSGAMRIGKDFILFTKRANTLTCVFLSRTFHESEGITEVVVPMPSWSQATKMPLAPSKSDMNKYSTEMDIITRFSPFKTVEDVMLQFDRIPGNGTLVMIYNLQLGDMGQTELDFTSQPDDFLMDSRDPVYSETEANMKPERRSFRAYSAILYYDPKMKIYIQNVKVKTKRLMDQLYKVRMYKFTSKRFKTRMEAEVKKAREDAKRADRIAKEKESTARDAEKRRDEPSKEARRVVREAQVVAQDATEEAKVKRLQVEAMEKSLKEPKTLDFIFGLNVGSRSQDGLFVYNCSRLIKMYERAGALADSTRNGEMNGLVGLVNVPYMVLEPTHNKQDFADAKEYRQLLKAMSDHLAQYWRDQGFDGRPDKVHDMWDSFGYQSPHTMVPQPDIKFKRRRNMQLLDWVQCDLCSKWREIPYNVKDPSREIATNWSCTMNTDGSRKKCSDPEQRKNFQIGQLQRAAPAATSGAATSSATTADKEAEKRRRRVEEAPVEEPVRKKRRQEDTDVLPPAAKRSAVSGSRASSTESNSNVHLAPSIVPQRRAAMDASVRIDRLSQTKSKPVMESSDEEDAMSPGISNTAMDDGEPTPSSEEDAPMVVKRGAPAKLARPASLPKSPQKRAPQRAVSMSTTNAGAGSVRGATALLSSPTHTDSGGQQVKSEKYPLQSRVQARISDKWHLATVVKYSIVKETGELRVRVKFDENEKDKYDKHFSVYSADLRQATASSEGASSLARGHGNGVAADLSSPDEFPPAATRPGALTSSHAQSGPHASASGGVGAAPSASSSAAALVDDAVARNFRTSLQYFLPPTWSMAKEEIGELGRSELANFPITAFFDQYESYLNRLVESFKRDAADQKKESEVKLHNLRRNVSKLLRSLTEQAAGDETEADETSEKVDQHLASIVNMPP